MIVLNFRLSTDAWNDTPHSTLTTADETDLRYNVLLGDIVFLAGTCDFGTNWGWVPIVDFVASMCVIADDLKIGRGTKHLFEFTESDANISLQAQGDFLKIQATYSPCTANVTIEEYIAAVDQLAAHSFRRLSDECPNLIHNHHFRKLLRQ